MGGLRTLYTKLKLVEEMPVGGSKRVSGTRNFLCAYWHNYQVRTEAPCATMWELIRKLHSSTQVQKRTNPKSKRKRTCWNHHVDSAKTYIKAWQNHSFHLAAMEERIFQVAVQTGKWKSFFAIEVTLIIFVLKLTSETDCTMVNGAADVNPIQADLMGSISTS